MYLEHYGLKEPPFSITPDPRFVFLSERHRDALAHLLFGIGQGGGGGFVQLTGEVGTGKTTLSRLLLEQIPQLESSVPTRVALVFNPRLSPVELLETICEELHLPVEGTHGSAKALTDTLNRYLLEAYAQGLRVVLVIDEAQNLSVEALEQVRLLTNLETDTQKLLQIILLGQPELREILARPELRQLAQRITARFHLTPLDANETAAYLRHRYRVAGGLHLPFDTAAIRRIHQHSGGVPRLINVIAERALLGGYAHDDTRIDARAIDRAAKEALAPKARAWRANRWLVPAGMGAAALALIAGVYAWRGLTAQIPPNSPAQAVVATAAASTPLIPAKQAQVESLEPEALAALIDGAAPASPLAWKALLELWKLPSDDLSIGIAASCPFAISIDAYCLRTRGTLDTIVAQNRPALLHLQSGTQDAWAVLLGVDARQARLSLDGRTFDIDRIALARHWNGEYATLWRGPENLTLPVTDGTPSIAWVRDQLTTRYLPVDAVARIDADMQAAVRRFQDDHGLPSDGVIGPATLTALASSDEGGPRLLKGLE